MIFNTVNLAEEQKQGLQIIQKDLSISFDKKGIELNVKKGEEFSIEYCNNKAEIIYKNKSEFYRAIAMMVFNGEKPLSYKGNRIFNDFGIHNNTNGISGNLQYYKTLIRKMALLGFSQFYLYIENNFELDGEPYFCNNQSRFTQAELIDLAEYGDILGVTIIPCLELLAHQSKLKRQPTYENLFEIDDVFDVSNEKTIILIEKIISTCQKCFKTDIIHFGLDEAYNIGQGKYLLKNGLRNRLDIFFEHLNKLITIAKKHGYKRYVIWSDMLYTSVNENRYYWGPNQLPKEYIDRIPKEVTLAYWDYYGTDNDHYNWCLKNHKDTGRRVMFCGGIWTWSGMITHNRWSMKILNMAFNYCNNNNVNDILLTSWGKAPILCGLPTICWASAYAYKEDNLYMKGLFKTVVGCEFDDFMKIDSVNYIDENQCYVYPIADQTLYNDYLIGLVDSAVVEGKNKIWLNTIEILKDAKERCKEYELFFNKSIALSKICYLKYDLGIKTRRAYLNKDKKEIAILIKKCYTPLIKLYMDYYNAEYKLWNAMYKIEGFECVDIKIGGMIMRTKHVIKILKKYIKGEISSIEELDREQLAIGGEGANFKFGEYRDTVFGFTNTFTRFFN